LEATIVQQIVQALITGNVSPANIGVITPYRGQVQLLEQTLRPDGTGFPCMKIATVDSFQGGECDYIVMSCVRNGRGIGFVKDERRLNVSLTRARFGLVIVGNKGTLSRDSQTWHALCRHFEAKGLMVDQLRQISRRMRK
jgi:regulator of nonsense transcripts 1